MSTPEGKQQEISNRMQISIYAYASEIARNPLVSAEEYSLLAKNIKTRVNTGSKDMDTFFRLEFGEYTNTWIYRHPYLEEVARIYKGLNSDG